MLHAREPVTETNADWALGPFKHPEKAQPVIKPDPTTRFDCPIRKESIPWEARHTFNPAATILDGRICVLYRAEDDRGPGGIGGYTSRAGFAISDDGVNFTREPKPVFYPAEDSQKEFEWTGGCEDPRLATAPDGTFIITYTQFNGTNGRNWRIGLATSPDLKTWTKHGSPFEGTPFDKARIKSASILHKEENGRLVAAKIGGQYWMYFGEESVHAATSTDLIHWKPLTDEGGGLRHIMKTRDGYFDSVLTEVGPPAVLTDHGIVLIYNGKNATPGKGGDPDLAKGVYTCGQALFDAKDPSKYLTRLDQPFFKPELPWEKSGQYKEGTTFAEGLVLHEGRWFLYYGCADTYVGVASAE
ncbi:glycoside hydrolase family 130 protein [Luteolibacter flavescens]|uniref:Glycoside hydrolase family 130 protein n=1 Tax=Luteolibacter flavescens TaxID=1859460 RepID=A0ABT3FSV2_9BACT|nr:glycoside hydrolase family 130 protein [Luteolibacter flavescens]MCW1886666.1 glycoside hydrolase family 130 protein [Luteolibacter flavescens]